MRSIMGLSISRSLPRPHVGEGWGYTTHGLILCFWREGPFKVFPSLQLSPTSGREGKSPLPHVGEGWGEGDAQHHGFTRWYSTYARSRNWRTQS